MSQCQYSLISQESEGIRLLRVLPDDIESEIKCEIFEYTLQDSGKRTHLYEALSYVWGIPENRRSIRADGYTFLVTENLYAALLHLRDRVFPRVIWIDAICIDQRNNMEKGKQIHLMSRIYGLAQRVIVWLGEAADESDMAIEDIRASAGEKILKSEYDVKQRQAVIRLLQRPWFERIWMLQEVTAARHVLLANVRLHRYRRTCLLFGRGERKGVLQPSQLEKFDTLRSLPDQRGYFQI